MLRDDEVLQIKQVNTHIGK